MAVAIGKRSTLVVLSTGERGPAPPLPDSYAGSTWALARTISWVRLLVKVLWHVISESFIATSPPSFRNEKGSGGSSDGCGSSAP